MAQRRDGVRKMLAGFSVDPSIVLLGRETIFRNGERVGWLTSGGSPLGCGRGSSAFATLAAVGLATLIAAVAGYVSGH